MRRKIRIYFHKKLKRSAAAAGCDSVAVFANIRNHVANIRNHFHLQEYVVHYASSYYFANSRSSYHPPCVLRCCRYERIFVSFLRQAAFKALLLYEQ